ncbi:MAG: TolB family protein [Anaerolineales bacterium]|uniref:TolB family protein n=1 Tax=Candidatus Desulfolinea nitratireducens TaxID=2841698 RepID=A0A8J6NJK3_9CHLR|nr:TolB family protein [Candidatus Desulfolinea nitratireducens]MBL6962020.1 TolB family protein [Anaerolineales bacterium]
MGYSYRVRILIGLLLLSLLAGCRGDADSPDFTPAPATQTPFAPNADAASTPVIFSDFPGIFILSINEGAYAHLFAYSPIDQPFLRLTSGEWDDISPALSPDGKQIAFASNRSGFWDLYLLEIESGETARLTNTKTYDGAPSWSPDGAWLASETYLDHSLEILIQPISDSGQEAIRLTDNPAADHSPAWAPDGRQVAFVSTRGGDSDIYLADLDDTGSNRFLNLSETPNAIEDHPVWSQDGSHLVWASNSYDNDPSGIFIWDIDKPNIPAAWVGEGDWAVWNQRGDSLLTMVESGKENYLSAYSLEGGLLLQPWPLPGALKGMLWLPDPLPVNLPQNYRNAAVVTPAPLWTSDIPTPESLSVRENLVALDDVQAPYPNLHHSVYASFEALREAIITRAGWDALANLENAFIPLTTALDPGMSDDWLYTGRAFSLNPLIASAGWMVSVRHEIGQQTYWNLYLHAQNQDGSMGMPLHDPVWDLSTRYNLDPATYETGGSFSAIPSGYWVDFTTLAKNYGWQRIPALSNWRNFYRGTRFTAFVQKGGVNWYEAMLDLYPPEILLTPTPVLPPSKTPTPTPIPTGTPRPTNTPRPTSTPLTLVPTSTPLSIFQFATSTP